MDLIVKFTMRYGAFEGVHSTFKVVGDHVQIYMDNSWKELTTCKDEFLVEVWFQCANLGIKRAIEALGLV